VSTASVDAIQFALLTDDGLEFVRLWNHGEFDLCRREWPEAPAKVYAVADPSEPTYSFAQVVRIMYDSDIHFYPLVEDLDFSEPEAFRWQLDSLVSNIAQKMGLQGDDEDHENVYNAICSFRPEIADYLAATTDQADAD